MAVQERELREIKWMKKFNGKQRGTAKKRNKIDEEVQSNAAVPESEMREIKSTKRVNATQHGNVRQRNERNKVDGELQRNTAQRRKREKSEK